MPRTREYWEERFRQRGSYWMYEGKPDPRYAHARLKSEKCSNGFFLARLTLEDALLRNKICWEMAGLLYAQGSSRPMRPIHRVVGPERGAVTLAAHLAYVIASMSGHACLDGYALKEDASQLGFEVEPGELYWVVEDVGTTFSTGLKVKRSIEAAGGIVLPHIGVLLNRSGMQEVEGSKILALVDRPMPTWDSPQECPYCQVGSEAIKPKATKENWRRITRAA